MTIVGSLAISERELAQFFTPDEAEVVWARKRTHDRPESLFALLVLLKSCARLGYFPSLDEVPARIAARARAAAGLAEDVVPAARRADSEALSRLDPGVPVPGA